MPQFILRAELIVNVPNVNSIEQQRREALASWNDLIWRHWTVHTSHDLNTRLHTTIQLVEGT